MKYLNSLIVEKINHKKWHLYKFKNKEQYIFHILFADDILLFGKANSETFQTINEVLRSFCVMSGMSINMDKSRVWFSKTVNDNSIQQLEYIINIKHHSDLGNYLGYPLKPKYKKTYFNFLLDKISTSFKSRQNTTNSLHLFKPFQSHDESLHASKKHSSKYWWKKIRKFLWGQNQQSRKLHTISWEKIL